MFVGQREINHGREMTAGIAIIARRATCTGAPRAASSASAALAPLAAISRWSVLPNSAQTSPGDASAYVETTRDTWCVPIRMSSGPPASFSNVRRSMLRDQVAEAIDAQHLAVDAAVVERGARDLEALHRARRPAERGEVDALGQPGRRRREAIAPLERAADGRPRVLPLGQLDDPLRRVFVENRRQHAVVGRHEPVVAGVGGDAAARRADAGIDDDEEDRCRPESSGTRRRARARRRARRARPRRARCRRASRRDRSPARRPSSCRRSDRACRSR